MSHLEILYRSLFTVITEYYKIRVKQEVSIQELMSKPLDELIPALDKIINDMLGSDTTRLQILYYLRDLIALSHPYLNSTDLLTATECFHLHGALTDFIININKLCAKYHNVTLKVTLDTTERELYGLLSGFLRTNLSRLGTLIHSKILEPLKINRESTAEEIASAINLMINEHETVKRNVENPLLTEIRALKLQNQTLVEQVVELSSELNQLQEKHAKILLQKEKTITSQETEITHLKELLAEAKIRQSRPIRVAPPWLSIYPQVEESSDTGYAGRLQLRDYP